jgi:predicted dinucleotide-utilizing enzyme
MTDDQLKQLLGTSLNHTAANAMTEAAERHAGEQTIPMVPHMGVALLIASVGVLSAELTDEQLDEVFAFVRNVTRPARVDNPPDPTPDPD